MQADALMITGPGQAEKSLLPGNPRVLSIAQFWDRAAGHDRINAERVAVIGGGETAASMLNELFRHRVSTITVISPQVTLFTRGEGFFENSLFSDPTDWAALTFDERRDALARTDRGVFSATVQEALLADDRIHHLRGRVAHAVGRQGQIRLTLSTNRGSENFETVHGFDLVIDARARSAVVHLTVQSAHPRPARAGTGWTADRRPPAGSDRLRLGSHRRHAQAVPAHPVRTHPGARVPQPELPRLVVGPGARRRHLYADQTQRHKEKR